MKLRHIYREGNKATGFLVNIPMENTNRDVMCWTTLEGTEICPATRCHMRSMAEEGPL